MAEAAATVNAKVENIGARRLQTVIEKVMEDISYTASDMSGQTVKIDAEYVKKRLGDIATDADLSRYIL
jgi:ATP-dependent HslUV protease ATP-binding subunit HslU